MKKFLSTFFCALAVCAGAYCNTAAGLKASQLHFSKMVGQGPDTAAIIIYCPSSDAYNAFMWGYLFNADDNAVVADAMQALVDEGGVMIDGIATSFITRIAWSNNVLSFDGQGNDNIYWMYNINDTYADAIGTQALQANDVINFEFTDDWQKPLKTYEGMLSEWINVYPVLDENYHPLDKLGDITFYAGTGSKHAAFVLYDPSMSHATVWGYSFDATDAVVADMLSAITAADSRLQIRGLETGWITSVAFTDDIVSFDTDGDESGAYWMLNLNDVAAPLGVSSMPLGDQDVVVFQFVNGSVVSIDYLTGNWLTYNADDPNLRGADLFTPLYTLGQGTAHATLTINYPASGKALTWGYNFTDDGTVMASTMLNDIATADERLTIDGATAGFISEIAYNGSEATFSNTGYNWMFSINDRIAPYGASQMPLHDGAAVYFEYTGGAWPYTIKRLNQISNMVTYVSVPGTALTAAHADETVSVRGHELVVRQAGMLQVIAANGQIVVNAPVEQGQTLSLGVPAGVYAAVLNNKALKIVIK